MERIFPIRQDSTRGVTDQCSPCVYIVETLEHDGSPPVVRSEARAIVSRHMLDSEAVRVSKGCLLAQDLGIALRRVGSCERLTFTNPGERKLDAWLDANAFVTWQVSDRPWELEAEVLRSDVPLPLNIRDNPCAAHTSRLSEIRRRAVATALTLPVVADNGGPRRSPVETP